MTLPSSAFASPLTTHPDSPPGSARQRWLEWTVLVVLTVSLATALMTHTLTHDTDGTVLIATRLWSDFASHVPLVRSFSQGANWPPEFPLFPGEPIRYHFLFYALAGWLERLGLGFDWAVNLPSIVGFALMLLAVHALGYEMTGRRSVGLLAMLFLLLNGSLSFLHYFRDKPLDWATVSGIVEVRDFLSFAPWGPGPVTAFWSLNIFTNQRHLALAYAIAIGLAAALLRRERVGPPALQASDLLWVAPIGLLPFLHQPALLIVAVTLLCYTLSFPHLRPVLIPLGLLSGLVVLPQVLTVLGAGGQVAWQPGYMVTDPRNPASVIEHWVHNLGLHLLLVPLGVWLLPSRARQALLPALVLFILANTLRFGREMAANHKFINYALYLGHIASACSLVLLVQACARWLGGRLWAYGISLLCAGLPLLLALTLSGIFDLMPIVHDRPGALADARRNPTVRWYLEHTPKRARVLNNSYLYHPASLAGRSIYFGWPYFAWSAGLPTEERLQSVRRLFAPTSLIALCHELGRAGITHVSFEDREPMQEVVRDERLYRQYFRLLYEEPVQGIRVYDAASGCQASRRDPNAAS